MSVAGTRNPAQPTQAQAQAMQAQAMQAQAAQRRNTVTEDKVKVNKPDEYSGDRKSLKDWLMQMDVYFAFNTIDEDKKTLFATTYLRGGAQRWMEPMLEAYLNDQTDDKEVFSSYATFKKEIRQIYGVSNEESTAERVIQHIQQRNSASEYAARFQEYSNQTDWDDAALQTMYRRGLKEGVKDELMRYGGQIADMEDLIKASIELDDKLYERAMEKRYDGEPRGKAGTYTKDPAPRYRGGGGGRFGGKKPVDNYGPAPMELGLTQKRNREKTPRGKQGSKADKKCYSCGKPGHFARDCRSKNMVQRRQINMTLRKEIPDKWDDETWEDTDESNSGSPVPTSDDEYTVVEDPRSLQEILDGIRPGRIGDTTREINNTLRQQVCSERPRTPYPHEGKTEARETDESGWNESDNKDFDQMVAELERHLEPAKVSEYVTDTLEQQLGSNANQERIIPNLVRQNAELVSVHDYKHWTFCYDNDCKTHRSGKDAGYYPTAPRRHGSIPHDLLWWDQCLKDNCEKHLVQEVHGLQAQHAGQLHRTLDWALCEEYNCEYHFKEQLKGRAVTTTGARYLKYKENSKKARQGNDSTLC